MYLSREAKELLDGNRIAELQALSFEKLIDASSYERYRQHCSDPLSVLARSLGTVPVDLEDSVEMDSMREPVVVSSGHIYSKATIDTLLSGTRPVLCPNTRIALREAFFGESPKQTAVRLPQIDAAMAHFRRLRDEAVGAAAGAGCGAGAGAGSAVAAPPSVAVTRPRVDEAIGALEACRGVAQIMLKVSGSKLRIIINSGTDRTALLALRPFFSAAFADKPTSEINASFAGYRVDGFGRCWQVRPDEARLEFWFPVDNRLTDTEVNDLMDALLRPLAIPSGELPLGVVFGSVKDLAPRDYKNAFIEPMVMSLQKVARCCDSFLRGTEALAGTRGIALGDMVIGMEPPIAPAMHSGVMFFGRPPAAASSASALAAVSTTVNQYFPPLPPFSSQSAWHYK